MAGLEKIVLNREGTMLYTGGKGLHLFSRVGTIFKPLDLDVNRDTELFAIKVNPSSGDVYIHEPSTNDLIHLNP